jgi:hypothetical protein
MRRGSAYHIALAGLLEQGFALPYNPTYRFKTSAAISSR